MNALLTGDIPFIEGSQLLFKRAKASAHAPLGSGVSESALGRGSSKDADRRRIRFGASLPNVGSGYCDAASRDELKSSLRATVEVAIRRSPPGTDQVIEGIDLRIANKAAQGPGVAAFLAKY